MVHRGTTREPKNLLIRQASTPEEKSRRHRNKVRIWRRCVKRLDSTIANIVAEPLAA